ncbi:MAG: DUF2807 domain-containing protein [Magnetococcales bacterium]|nr:DUF2807 domain-containing protein [Magnetococcales bacterium]
MRLDNIVFPLRIHTRSQPETVVRATGPSPKDALAFRQHGEELTIQGKSAVTQTNSQGNLSVTTTYGSIRQTVVGENAKGSIEIGGIPLANKSAHDTSTRLELELPKGTSIAIVGTCHLVEIDATHGPLDVDINGACDLKAGTMGAVNVRVDGACTVDIASAAHQLTINAQGASDIQVRGGEVETLQIELSGSGDVVFGGVARKVRASLQGVGNVTVHKSLTDPDIKNDGVGDVTIGR